MKERSHAHLHIGTASILLIFLTLCLVSFAVLSLVNANADLRLSRKLADRTAAYYVALSEAEVFLKETDEALAEEDSREAGDIITASFPVGEGEIQSLEVELVVLAERDAGTGHRYRVVKYRVENDESGLTYDDTLNVVY